MPKPVVEVNNLNFSYGENKLLDNISFRLNEQEYVALIGENGSGKSTFVKLITGILKNYSGEIKLFDQDIKTFQDWYKIGYLSQRIINGLTEFPINVSEIIKNGFDARSGLDAKTQFEKMIELLNLESVIETRIGNLSGGQTQRVFIARSLINNPELLVLDEPSNNIDKQSQVSLFDFLKKINSETKTTVIHITHDIDRIKKEVHRVLCIDKNNFCEQDPELEHVHH